MASRAVTILLNGKNNAGAALDSVNSGLQKIGTTARGVTNLLGGLVAGFSVFQAGKGIISLAGGMENLQVQFETMLQSGTKANQMLADINKFAAETPFETEELAKATKLLLAFGFEQEKIIPNLRRLGDIASGLGIPLTELAELYGKARVQGRLFAEDINQLTGRGIPVIQQFAKQFGVADSEVRKLVESGKIGFPQLEQAFVDLTAKGSMFGGGMSKLSQTLQGQWSTLTDSVKMLAVEIGTVLLPTLKAAVKEASILMDLRTGTASTSADQVFNALKDFDKTTNPRMNIPDIKSRSRELLNLRNGLMQDIEDTQKAIDLTGARDPAALLRQQSNRRALEAINQRMDTLIMLRKRVKEDVFDQFSVEIGSGAKTLGGLFGRGGNIAGAFGGNVMDAGKGLWKRMGEEAESRKKQNDAVAKLIEDAKTPEERLLDKIKETERLKDRFGAGEFEKTKAGLQRELQELRDRESKTTKTKRSDFGDMANAAVESNRLTGSVAGGIWADMRDTQKQQARDQKESLRIQRRMLSVAEENARNAFKGAKFRMAMGV